MTDPEFCMRCGKPLDENRIVWLEFDTPAGVYRKEGCVRPEDSQGLFPFGADCAKREEFGATDLVHEDTAGWWFWDETWARRHGPFSDEVVARSALLRYANAL